MTPSARRSLVAAFAVLSVIGLVRSCATVSEVHPTTRGTAPWGYGAFFELCQRLWPATRRAPVIDVPTSAAVWWLPGAAACHARALAATAPWPLTPWVEAGGTAIVPLPGRGDRRCEIASDVAVPARARTPIAPTATVEAPGMLARPRRLEPPPRVFGSLDDAWQTLVRAGGRPFVIARRVGAGRLVVIADASFLTNEQLARGDAAPLAAELVAAWGPPVFADPAASHGAHGPLAYLAGSMGVLPLAALAVLGVLVAWHGASVPMRTTPPDTPPAPQLGDFVRSLARLLRRSHDRNGLLASHHAWAVSVLAPRLGLPPNAAGDLVVRRLRAVHGDAVARVLEDASPVRNARELDRRLAAVAAVVENVVA